MSAGRRSVSALWSTLSAAARAGARAGLLRSERLDARRVLGVGNLQAGGAGKTPLVARIAREGVDRGLSVCILNRGYRGAWEREGGMIRSGEPPARAAACGDEAALLHDLVPGAWIAVGADRVRAYAGAREALGRPFDLVILDDGFQHWRIRKDLEIVALTSATPGERLFRDFPRALARADLVVWTKGLRRPASGGKPLVVVRYALPPGSGREIRLVTGLGDNEDARRLAEDSGYRVREHLTFGDHAVFGRVRVREILDEARALGCEVAVTGKDWVKWRDVGVAPGQALVLEPELKFEEGRELWERVLWGS